MGQSLSPLRRLVIARCCVPRKSRAVPLLQGAEQLGWKPRPESVLAAGTGRLDDTKYRSLSGDAYYRTNWVRAKLTLT